MVRHPFSCLKFQIAHSKTGLKYRIWTKVKDVLSNFGIKNSGKLLMSRQLLACSADNFRKNYIYSLLLYDDDWTTNGFSKVKDVFGNFRNCVTAKCEVRRQKLTILTSSKAKRQPLECKTILVTHLSMWLSLGEEGFTLSPKTPLHLARSECWRRTY